MRSRAVLLSVLSMLGAVVLATPAHAATPSTMSLASTSKTVTTSKGFKLHLTISANKVTTSGSTAKANASVTLATGAPYGLGETHSWSFSLSRSSFTYSSSTGKAVLKSGTQMSPYGAVNLTFHRSSSKTKSCAGGGRITTVSGTLAGIVHFVTNTGTHGWGNVGSSTHSMSFSTPNHLTLLSGCGGGQGGAAVCSTFTSWSAPYATSAKTSFNGFSVKNGSTTSTTITAYRSKTLSKPAKANRTDVLVAAAPAPTFSAGTLTIHTKSGAKITGSASIVQSSIFPNSYACKSGSVSHTENAPTYLGSWSTSTSMVAHFRVTGNATAPSTGQGSFTIASFS